MNTVNLRKYAADQGIAEEATLAEGSEEPSAARWTIRRVARKGEAKRSQKSKKVMERRAEVYAKA